MVDSRGRQWLTWGVTAAMAAGLVMTSTSAANAETPEEVCNNNSSGDTNYVVNNDADLPDGLGTVYLLWDHTSGTNCAITMGTASGSTYMDVGLRHTGGSNAEWDHGDFTQYAGPVYLEANFTCVDFTGAVGERSVTSLDKNCDGNDDLD